MRNWKIVAYGSYAGSDIEYPLMRNWKPAGIGQSTLTATLVSFNEELKVGCGVPSIYVDAPVSFNEELKATLRHTVHMANIFWYPLMRNWKCFRMQELESTGQVSFNEELKGFGSHRNGGFHLPVSFNEELKVDVIYMCFSVVCVLYPLMRNWKLWKLSKDSQLVWSIL